MRNASGWNTWKRWIEPRVGEDSEADAVRDAAALARAEEPSLFLGLWQSLVVAASSAIGWSSELQEVSCCTRAKVQRERCTAVTRSW